MAGLNLLDFSPDLVKIRPVSLKDTDMEQLAIRWRSCYCCREPLGEEAVQVQCCDSIYHIHCMQDFAQSRALTRKPTPEQPDFFCPWCASTLDCRPSDVWAFLNQSAITKVLQVGKVLDKCLALLSKLRKDARAEFMELASDYENLLGHPSRAIRLPAKITRTHKFCQGDPSALRAFDTLYEARNLSFDALLEWREWLVSDDDVEEGTDLVLAETLYGHGPDRFVPRIVRRLQNG